jgi:hypothetical protein
VNDDAGKGLGRIVVAVLEVVCELLERQALRRVDAGTLTADQVEALGQALISLERQFTTLRSALGITGPTGVDLPVDITHLFDDFARKRTSP